MLLLAVLLLPVLLLSPVAIVVGLVVAYRKLPLAAFCLLALMLVAAPVAAYTMYAHNFMLESVPDALGVHSIEYSKEETWGFGPGGNEAGIRVFPLSEQMAARVKEGGAGFLENLPPNRNDRGWRGRFSDWRQTPIEEERRWARNARSGLFDVYDYVCAYGFCIEIEPAMVKEVNAIVNSPGSYYAYGRVGLIVVSPGRKRVVYLYNG